MNFKVGDRVNVNFRLQSKWNGPGSITKNYWGKLFQVTTDTGLVGGFFPNEMALIEPEKTLGDFKVGDRVRVKASRGTDFAMRPATVVELTDKFIRIKADRIARIEGFYPQNVEHLTETKAVQPTSKVFEVAKSLAIANALGNPNRTTNADKVQELLVGAGYKSTDLGNAAGVLFRGKNWKKVSSIRSQRKGNHAREITNWKYIGA